METKAWFATIAAAFAAALVAAEEEVEAPTTLTASSLQKGARPPTPAYRSDMMWSDITYSEDGEASTDASFQEAKHYSKGTARNRRGAGR